MRSLLFFMLTAFLYSGASGQKLNSPYALNELLVKTDVSAEKKTSVKIFSKFGAQLIETLGDTGWHRLRLRKGSNVKDIAAELAREPQIVAAQPNYYYHLLNTPNDPQWGSAGMYGLPKISAPQAWDLTTGNSSVVVADIDTGIRYTHEDLAANVWTNPGEINGNGIDDDGNGFADDYYGYDFFYNDPDPMDENNHGSHTAGTIGASGNNALGVVGVNWNVKIMAVKIYNSSGLGTTSSMLINAYNYIRMMKLRGVNIRVTNNSYSGCDEACGYDQATKDALDAMGDAGILNVFAAGNQSWDNDSTPAPAYPASYDSPSILAVASSNSLDARSSFSNWGLTSVDLAAPGSSILSTIKSSDSAYGILSGTSMASPHVAGAAALLSAYDPTLSVASLKATLMNSVDPLAEWTSLVKTGGRLNVFKALQDRTVCAFDLSSEQIAVRTKGGYYQFSVSSGANCDYAPKSNDRWIRLENTGSLSGNGQIVFRVGVNPTITRSGTITVGGKTVTITQTRSGIL